MPNYNVGNIEIGILSNSDKALKTLDLVIAKIQGMDNATKSAIKSFDSVNRLANGLVKLNKIDFGITNKQFDETVSSLSSVITRLNQIQAPTKEFEKTASALNKIANTFRQFNNMDNFDFDKLKQNVEQLSNALDPLLFKLNESKDTIMAFSNILSKLKTANVSRVSKVTERIKNDSGKASSNFNKMFTIGKIYFFLNYTKRLRNALTNIINRSMEFEETLNKFQVSFGALSDEATKFAKEMAYAFNLSTESIMNYMSTFNSMLKGLGSLEPAQASALSKTLTQLALDYSSLFNVSVESSMNAFQSVLSGQIRTIRSVSGIDVSETSIFQYYQELGGQKSIRQLSQLEKRLLRIYAIERQMDALGAVGDLDKTMNSLSNVTRQISETWKELSLYLGNIARGIFEPFIRGTLTVLLVLKDLAKWFAEINGYLTKEYDNDTANSLFGSIEESAESADEAVEGLLGKLSFDRFEALQSSSDTTSDLEKILNGIQNISVDFSKIESSARRTADSILNWLGFTRELNKETGELELKLRDGYTNLEKIVDVLELIGIYVTLLIGKKIVTYIQKITVASAKLNMVLATGVIFSLVNLIQAIKDGNVAMSVLYGSILLVTAAIFVWNNITKITLTIKKLTSALLLLDIYLTTLGTSLLRVTIAGGALFAVVGLIMTVMNNWSNMNTIQKVISVLGSLTAACFAAAIALGAFKSAWSMGLAAGAIIAGIVATTAAVESAKNKSNSIGKIKMYADGGFPTRGQLFIANEAGPELVGNIGSRTSVANNDMITTSLENAMYRGMARANAIGSNSRDKVEFTFKNTNDSALARLISQPLMDELLRQGYVINKA